MNKTDSFMNTIQVGTKLEIDNEYNGQVIGYIDYRNPKDGNKTWRECRVQTDKGIVWLSLDEHYQEYSISFPTELKNGQIDPVWKKVDEGEQIVVYACGDVDVDEEESASFVEFEDVTGEKTFSLETWEDGTEASTGYYLDREEIKITGYDSVTSSEKTGCSTFIFGFLILFFVLYMSFDMLSGIYNRFAGYKGVEEYLKSESKYVYATSITGNEKQKASVYESHYKIKKDGVFLQAKVDEVAKDIIKGIEGITESVTENQEGDEIKSISIVTAKEYCLVYTAEDDPNQVMIQVSNRKYNYTSDNSPYRASTSTTRWYRGHYYSSAYTKDSGKWKSTPSAYTMYDGPVMHDLGNGYFDVYSNNIRQESIRRRNSSEGGVNRGK